MEMQNINTSTGTQSGGKQKTKKTKQGQKRLQQSIEQMTVDFFCQCRCSVIINGQENQAK